MESTPPYDLELPRALLLSFYHSFWTVAGESFKNAQTELGLT